MSEQVHIDPSIKEFIQIVKDVWNHMLRYWYLLLIFLVLALIFARIKKQIPTVAYVANLTFTINQLNPSKSEESNVASLMSEFGLGGSSQNMNTVNANRLIELSKSNSVLSEVLFREYEIGGETDYLANHYLSITDMGMSDSSYFQNFTVLDSLSRGENAVLNRIINQLRNQNLLFTISPAQIFKMTTQSPNEEFSKVLAEAYYHSLSELYVRGAIAKAQATFEFAEDRLEKATNQLLSAEQSLAGWQDRNLNLVKRSAYLTQTDLERKVAIYNGVYLEALKSFEAAKINLENQRPVFQMIDPPRYPLDRVITSGSNTFMYAIIGAIALFLFITISLYFYKKYGYLVKELLE